MNKAVVFGIALLAILVLSLVLAVPALGLAGLASLGGGSEDKKCPAAEDSSTAEGPLYIVGDSLMEGTYPTLRPKLQEKGIESSANAVQNRTLPQGASAVLTDVEKVRPAKSVLVMLGTNPGSFDQASFTAGVKEVVAAVTEAKKKPGGGDAPPEAKLYWVEVFSKVENVTARNDVIKSEAGDFEVIPVDLKESDFAGDNVHLQGDGYEKLAGQIAEALGGEPAEGDASCEEEEGGGRVSADVTDNAQKLLDSNNVSFPLDASSPNGSTENVLEDVAQGNKFSTTCPTIGGRRVDVNPKMIQFLVDLAQETKIGINAITDKCHSSGSNHYKGTAVDFECKGVPFDLEKGDRVAKKYGGGRNSETCAANDHWHYDFPK